jgi:hypothetical protein
MIRGYDPRWTLAAHTLFDDILFTTCEGHMGVNTGCHCQVSNISSLYYLPSALYFVWLLHIIWSMHKLFFLTAAFFLVFETLACIQGKYLLAHMDSECRLYFNVLVLLCYFLHSLVFFSSSFTGFFCSHVQKLYKTSFVMFLR